MNCRSNVAAVLCIAGPTLRWSFELPVKRARSFDRRSNVPGLLICSGLPLPKFFTIYHLPVLLHSFYFNSDHMH